MKIQIFDKDHLVVELNEDELQCIWGSLNEVTQGFLLTDFEEKTGFTKPEAAEFRLKLITIKNSQAAAEFAKKEIFFVIAAIKETLQELESEFSIRVGVTEEEAQALLTELKDAYAKMQLI